MTTEPAETMQPTPGAGHRRTGSLKVICKSTTRTTLLFGNCTVEICSSRARAVSAFQTHFNLNNFSKIPKEDNLTVCDVIRKTVSVAASYVVVARSRCKCKAPLPRNSLPRG